MYAVHLRGVGIGEGGWDEGTGGGQQKSSICTKLKVCALVCGVQSSAAMGGLGGYRSHGGCRVRVGDLCSLCSCVYRSGVHLVARGGSQSVTTVTDVCAPVVCMCGGNAVTMRLIA